MADDRPDRPDDPEWTDERVNEKVREMEWVWGGRKSADQLRYDQYNNVDSTEAPKPEDLKDLIVPPKIIKGGMAMEIIDFFTGITAIQSEHTIDAHGVGGEVQDAAERGSTWLNAYGPAGEFQSGEDTTLLTTREALTIGYSAIKTLPYPKALRDWPGRNKGERGTKYTERVKAYEEENPQIPIRSYHVPGLTWFPLLYGRQVLLHIEKKRVSVAWARARYGEHIADWTGAKATDECDFIEIIDPTWCGYYLKGDDADKMRNVRFWKHEVNLPDGQCPVAIYECNKTSATKLLDRWHSLIESIRDPLEVQDMILTMQATMMRAFYQPTLILDLLQNWSPGQHSANMRERKFKIGATNVQYLGADGTTGEKYHLFELPNNLPALEFMQNYVSSRVNSFLPPALIGHSAAGDSGYKANRDTENAERRLNPIVDNFARADADKARHAFACVGAVAKLQGREDARVFIKKADGKGSQSIGVTFPEVKGYIDYGIQTSREYVLETDFLMMADAATKWLSDPIRAPRDYVLPNILRINNPNEFDLARLTEDIRNDPAFREKDVQNALVKMGVKAADEDGIPVEELAQILAQGGVLPPGVFMPGAPDVAPPAGVGPASMDAGPGITGADQPQLESPAASSPIDAPMPAPDVRTAAPQPPVASGRSGQARRQEARPRPKRTKGKGK